MNAQELRKVLDDHALHERNKDSFFIMSICLIIMAILLVIAIFNWAKRVLPPKYQDYRKWKKEQDDRITMGLFKD